MGMGICVGVVWVRVLWGRGVGELGGEGVGVFWGRDGVGAGAQAVRSIRNIKERRRKDFTLSWEFGENRG